MTDSLPAPIRLHQDPSLFREAVRFTSVETGFSTRLVEKDYFATVLLQYVSGLSQELVFRGGTCLSKIHFGFYRMSEDLDFCVPVPMTSTRRQRSRSIAWLKGELEGIEHYSGVMKLQMPLTGANNSTQYTAIIGYRSLLNRQDESLKLEVGLREPLLTPVEHGAAKTLLLDPVSGKPALPALSVPCLSRLEAIAEKIRAALSRRDIAIRDFFDIDFAVTREGLDLNADELIRLIQQKLSVPGNAPVDLSDSRLSELRAQLDAQLKPVLRTSDFDEFDLDRAVQTATAIVSRVS